MTTTTITKKLIDGFYDDGAGRVYSDYIFEHCVIESSAISITKNPALRTTFRNIMLLNCEQRGCAIDTAVLEDVTVDGLKTHTPLQAWGAVCKHVTLKGNVGRIMFSPAVSTGMASPEVQHAFDKANAAYYKNVDWAVDVSQGEFYACELQSIPANLVRRDPETQVVINRRNLMDGAWKNLDLSKTYWKTSIDFLLWREGTDVVLVAPKRNPKFKDLLAGLQLLRKAGIADPD